MSNVEDEITIPNVWKPDLYRMQLEAPSARPIYCNDVTENVPWSNNADYHGSISHLQAVEILQNQPEGAYLVRSSPGSNGSFYTLSLKFNGKVHHYKLYYEPGSGTSNVVFYVREKRYSSVFELVADGLVSMYLKLKVPMLLQNNFETTVSYQESPYMTLNKRKLKVLSKKHCSTPLVISTPTSAPIIGGGYGGEVTPTQPTKKPHMFQVHTFKGLNWCEFCGNFLWGFTQQGVKCEDCGFTAHVKCSSAVPADCVPDLKQVRGVFGLDLTSVSRTKDGVPFVIIKCIDEIESRGLLTEGIYRLSGFADEIEELKLALDTDGESANLSETQYSNINVIAGVLKLYLRLLPVPLITFSAYPTLISALSNKSNQLEALKYNLVKYLPRQHYNTLKYLMGHLRRVSQHQAINKMTAHNLGTVFAPTLIGPSPSQLESGGPPDITTDIFLIEFIITNFTELF